MENVGEEIDVGNVKVRLPIGEKWMADCKPGEEGWDVVDGVLQKGKLEGTSKRGLI